MNDSEIRDRWQTAATGGVLEQGSVLTQWLATSTTYSDASSRRLTDVLAGLCARQAALGARELTDITTDQAAGFVFALTRRGARPSNATIHLRRTAIRTLVAAVAELGRPMADPCATLALPAKTRAGFRPLTIEELPLLRVAATSRRRSRGAAVAAVALAEAGATTGEIALLRWNDLTADAKQVDLPGAGKVAPRTVQLTAWGAAGIQEHRRRACPDLLAPVVYAGTAAPDSDAAQAAVTTRLRKLLTTAGIPPSEVRPGSIRLCRPAADLAAGGHIEQAALTLGLASLDVTAELLAYDWRR